MNLWDKSSRPGLGRAAALLLLIAVALFALTACGGSSSSSSSGGDEGSTAETVAENEGGGASEEGEEASSGGGAGVEEAAAAIAEYEKKPTSIGISEPLKERPTGDTFAFVQCEVPECTDIGDYIEPAAKAMGVKLERINAGNTPEEFQKGFSVALQKNPDALIVPALDPVLYPEQLKEINAKGIPLIIWTVPEPVGDGITANLINNEEYTLNGQLLADYVTAKSEGKGKALYVTVPEYTVFKTQAKAFEDQIAKVCPECDSETLSVTIQEVGKGLPGRIVSYLQENPDTDWIVGAFGSVMTGVPAAIEAAGLEAPSSLTQSAVPEIFQYIQEGKQTADLSLDKKILAWKAVDAAARAVTGQSLKADEENGVPIQFLTQKEITFDPEEDWVAVPDFEAEFEKLWGLK